jgi:hypothetical protein
MEGKMGKKTFFVVFLVVVFGAQGLAADEGFTWHLALVSGSQGLPFDDTVSMNEGERYNIQFSTEKECYAYMVLEQSSGALKSVFSKKIKAKTPQVVGPYTLVQPSGQEKFYVVTSIVEQKELQRAIDNHKKDGSVMNADILKDILFEIRDPGGEIPGRPAVFTGALRAADGASTVNGMAYSGSSVYTRTITISH